jgi:hypothetical protein
VKTHRSITSLAAVIVLALSLAVVDAAQAGSLLSGYGGPGQGNQAILGSTLIGGSSGGGGSAGGGSGGAGEGSYGGGSGALSVAGSGGPASSSGHAAPGGHSRATRHHRNTSAPARDATGLTRAPNARLTAATAGSQPLGLSGHDLLFALLVLALLAATAVLTMRLARPGPRAGSTKGMGRGTRVTE